MLKYKIKNLLAIIIHLFLRCFFFIVFVFVTVLPYFLIIYLSNLIAFSDAHVIATSPTFAIFLSLPLGIYIIYHGGTLYRWYFPNLTQYERHPWERDFYESRSQKRRRRRKGFLTWLIGFIFFLLLSGLSLSGRICLTDDGQIQRYNMWNQLTEEISPEDITTVILNTHSGNKNNGWNSYYSIRFFDAEENDYWFSRREFRFSDQKTLQSILDIKSLYVPEQITVNSAEPLENVVQDCELSEEEAALLYKLFEENP